MIVLYGALVFLERSLNLSLSGYSEVGTASCLYSVQEF